ncbi:N-acetylglucosamine kinase [Curtobacterium sp. 9128]|uniref:N-acetylglucosamine kinase n=1 Tax=Curtobacterium sp. 9128 TaxID=1793722 RepID=UPI0011A9FEAB|nr:BadF/BadG/BcrA/BcrD ATPase family protein [Curtobacterium sp. 9128]
MPTAEPTAVVDPAAVADPVAIVDPVVLVDLGKTTCRVRVADRSASGHGSAGLAEHDGLEDAIAAITDALSGLDAPGPAPTALAAFGGGVAIGAAGAATAPDRARELADRVARASGGRVVVTSDVVTAHAGALGGEPGTVLVAGTGAVAIGIDGSGRLRRADGSGIWLGDDGSGRWIGQRGLRAALRAHDGRGRDTTLREAAAALAPTLDTLPGVVGGSATPERTLAAFAPVVLSHAADGDAVAADIVERAVGHLVTTTGTVTPAGPARIVAVTGGLVADDWFAARLRQALVDDGLEVLDPLGDALDGAARILDDPDLPHERQVSRVDAP